MRSIVVGTAGHIDHGKTALVQAITGIDPSRLSEEKRRGITIDLGFAFREVASTDGAPFRISFVDVPGHSGFIRNMLAGAGGINMVLLVISAEEGVKPQTREHLAICSLLGVQRGLAVLTKTDAVSPEHLKAVRGEVADFLQGSFLESEPLPVSARTGAGLNEVLDRMVALARQLEPGDASGPVRLPLDRCFTVNGFGTVVTGTLMSGRIELGQKLVIEPGGRKVRVRSIQTHGRTCDFSVAGSRVALNLAGIDHSSITRGDTVVSAEPLTAVDEFDAEITLLPDAAPMKHGLRVSFHAFTFECPASILLYGQSRLEPGSSALARLKLRQLVVLAPADRFILRLPSPSETIGGGTVLDASPIAGQSRHEARKWLEDLQSANRSIEELLIRRVTRRKLDGLDRGRAAAEMGMSQTRIDETLASCARAKTLAPIGEVHFVEYSLYDAALRRVQAEVAGFHADRPAEGGIKKGELQRRSELPAALFASVLDELSSKNAIVICGDMVSGARFRATLQADDRGYLNTLSSLYADADLEAPNLRDIAGALRIAEREVQRLLAVLVKENVLVKIGNDAYVHRASLAGLRMKLSELRGQRLDVGQFKQLANLSRKHAIPWLEYLDRERITCRVGDTRLVL